MKDFVPLLAFLILAFFVGGMLYPICQKLCMLFCKRRFVFGKRQLRSADDVPDIFFNALFFVGTVLIVSFLYLVFMEYVFIRF
jgi:hypothetical protein